jgi:hypothetical protein
MVEGLLGIFAFFDQLKVSAERWRNRIFVFDPILIHRLDIIQIADRQKIVLELRNFGE